VPGDYQELKRYNLSEIYGPNPAEAPEAKEGANEGAAHSGPAAITQDKPEEVPT